MNGQADKTRTISITMPESIIEELKEIALSLDSSVSHTLLTCFFLQKDALKKIPCLIQIYENHKVMQYYHGNAGTVKIVE